MKINHIITIKLTVTALLLTGSLFAQQDPAYTFYRYNMNLYNPAFAGSSDRGEFVLGLRSQWAGVEGAPESQSAIFSMPLGANLGLGASVLNDRTFIERQTWMAVDVSYRLDIGPNNALYFGIKGSANSYDANTSGLLTYGMGQDPTLMDFESRFTPNVGAGAYLKGERSFLSLSVPKILTPERLQQQNGNAYLDDDRIHAYLSGGYEFPLGSTLNLKSMGMLRYADASPLSVELTGILDFGQRFELGASYRISESVGGLFLFNISSGFNLGYAYESSLENPINGMNNGTHELFMRMSL